jgi:hypothetical protein
LFPLAGTTAKTLQRDGGWVSSKLPIKTNPGQIQSAVDKRQIPQRAVVADIRDKPHEGLRESPDGQTGEEKARGG